MYSQPPGPETARQLQTISELETEIESVRKLLDERDLTIKLLVKRIRLRVMLVRMRRGDK